MGKRAKLDALGYILDKSGNRIATYNHKGERVRVNYKGFEIRTFTIKGFRVTTNYLCNKLWSADDNMRNYNNHRITVSKDGKRCSFEYWGSIANPEITNEIDAFYAVCCLASDAVAGLMDFEEFCNEFGYDTDSRKAKKSWKACKRAAAKVQRCFGDVYEFAELFNDSQTDDDTETERNKS